jgi:hypothetical protein
VDGPDALDGEDDLGVPDGEPFKDFEWGARP